VALIAAVTPSSASAAALFQAAFRTFDAGRGARSLAIGDFDRDGRPDVVVANSGAPTVSLLENLAGGLLGDPVAFATGANPSAWVAAGDLNGDGWLDVVFVDGVYAESPSRVGVMFGAPGGLQPAAIYPVGRGASWVTLSDVNGDGALDVLTANSDTFYSHSVSVLLGDGSGTLGSAHDVDFFVGPTCVAAGDLNEDGRDDIAAVGPNGTFVYVRLGSGDGSFGPYTAFAVAPNPRWISMADLSGDGHLDIVSGGDRMAILLGKGDGTFAPAAFLDPGGWVPAVADFNRDGIPDLAATRYGGSVTVWLGTGSGSFAAPASFATGFNDSPLAVGDMDGDDIPDIVSASDFNSAVSVRPGNGDGSFGRALDYAVGAFPTAAAAGDLDGQGALDLVVANSNSGSLSLFRGGGDGTFTLAGTEAAVFPNTVSIDDLNRDGIQDLVVGGAGATVLLGAGSMVYQAPVTYGDTLDSPDVAVGDLNGDGIADLALGDLGHPGATRWDPWIPGVAVHVFHGVGDGTFLPETTCAVGLNPYDLAIADLDGNGRDDLVAANAASSTISVLLADGGGRLQGQVEYPVAGGATILAVADFDEDGQVDVVVGQPSDQLSILRGIGKGMLGAPAVIGSFFHPQALAAADLDRDGHVDLALSTDYGDGITLLHGIGNGTFAVDDVYGTGVGPGRLAVGDFDRDGDLDLAAPNGYSRTLTILKNLTALTVAAPSPPSPAVSRLEISRITPNPVRSSASVRFAIPSPGPASLDVFDALGRRVTTIFRNAPRPGTFQEVSIPTNGWPGGVYFCRLAAGGTIATRKFVVLR
jgi:hypothetical protein